MATLDGIEKVRSTHEADYPQFVQALSSLCLICPDLLRPLNELRNSRVRPRQVLTWPHGPAARDDNRSQNGAERPRRSLPLKFLDPSKPS
jgi:hypothetical protein